MISRARTHAQPNARDLPRTDAHALDGRPMRALGLAWSLPAILSSGLGGIHVHMSSESDRSSIGDVVGGVHGGKCACHANRVPRP